MSINSFLLQNRYITRAFQAGDDTWDGGNVKNNSPFLQLFFVAINLCNNLHHKPVIVPWFKGQYVLIVPWFKGQYVLIVPWFKGQYVPILSYSYTSPIVPKIVNYGRVPL
jgi:hypothetical protein